MNEHITVPVSELPPGTDRRRCLDVLRAGLKLPVMLSPMFLASGPKFVIAACRAGIIGSFPAPNARTLTDLEAWLGEIFGACQPGQAAAWAINLLVHTSNGRLGKEVRLVQQYKPSLVITALGTPARVREAVHEYGGTVFADVTTPTFARKAIAAGADGLVLVCAGAGGHTGDYSPFAFLHDVRQFWAGPAVLAGAVADARSILAAKILGADLVYMGTRFICATESMVSDEYRNMLVASRMEDVILTKAVTGVKANFMRASLELAGFNETTLAIDRKIDFSTERLSDAKAWKTIWGAGQGVGCVERVANIEEIVAQLAADYAAIAKEFGRAHD